MTLSFHLLSSPLIQHKIDLHAAGFEYNPAAGIDLSESRKALRQYLSNLNLSCPIEERVVENPRIGEWGENVKAAGGVMTIVNESVRLFTLGSSSRRIPYKEWEIPLPSFGVQRCDFYPGVDIIAFVELQEEKCVYLVIKIVAELTSM